MKKRKKRSPLIRSITQTASLVVLSPQDPPPTPPQGRGVVTTDLRPHQQDIILLSARRTGVCSPHKAQMDIQSIF